MKVWLLWFPCNNMATSDIYIEDEGSSTEDEGSIFAALQYTRRYLRKIKKMSQENPSEKMETILQDAINLYKQAISVTDVSVKARLDVLDKQIQGNTQNT